MSFTADVKDEMCRIPATCSHCNRSLLSALIRIEGTLHLVNGSYRLEIATDSILVGRLLIKLIHELYHLKTDFTVRQSVLHKTQNYLIELPPQPGLADALADLGIITASGGLEFGIKPDLIRKQCCAAAYLRGAFLGSGFIASPRGDFHFEIAVSGRELAEGLVGILNDREIPAKMVQRRNTFVVYLKSGEAICDVLAMTGAHQCALRMENERVYKSMRNDVNRKTNAEVANQGKTVDSAVRQVFAIRKVVDEYGVENLPTALQEYIRLRVSHPEAYLQELGEYANPKLSKSAIYHRVRRIEQMAAEIDARKSRR
ncbi:MAG: DNA-binding protein WhiA [Eggerthellaceae bacterium]|nr:DNA-binding protein WhiA [Eggerthellaceae bacterium]